MAHHEPTELEISGTYPPRDPIVAAVFDILNSTRAISAMFDTLDSGLTADHERAHSIWQTVAQDMVYQPESRRGASSKRIPFDAPLVKQRAYIDALWNLNGTALAANQVGEILLLKLVAEYDRFLALLLRATIDKKPSLLKYHEQTLMWRDIVDLSDKDYIKALYVERVVDNLLHEGRAKQFELFIKRHGLDRDLFGSTLESDFYEVTERRNLVAHSGGRVTQNYVRVTSGSKWSRDLEVRDRVLISKEYIVHACDAIFLVAVVLSQRVWRKSAKSEEDEADSFLSYLVYVFLAREEWRLAQQLLEFALDQRPANETRTLVFIVNAAQAAKWLGEDEKCEDLLRGVDWEAKDAAFQLSYAVLTEQWDEAEELMLGMRGSTSQVQQSAFDHWPLYRQFRKTEQYGRAYESIWGHRPPDGGSH